VEQHNEWNVVLSYKEVGKEDRTRMAGVYLKPNRSIVYLRKGMKDLENCDIIMGDLNARHPLWEGRAGDNGINQHRRMIRSWTEDNGFDALEHDHKTFRTVSVINLTLYKRNGTILKVQLIDKMGLEHCGQVVRKCLEEPVGLMEKGIARRKVDWKDMEEKLKDLKEDGEGGWEGLKRIVEGLIKTKGGVRNNDWSNEELENMAKDMKKLRREGSEDRKLVQKVFRNRLLQERYRKMKDQLAKTGEIEAFRMVKQLEGRRAIPPMQSPDGRTVFEFEKVSDMIVEQLEPGEEKERVEEEVKISAKMEDLKTALKDSPSNTAGGIDKMSYLLLRFWLRKDGDRMLALVNEWIKRDCWDWHRAERVLIKKGDKSRYDVVKLWRMIHLLPVLAKVVERIILRIMTKYVELEDTQYGSRKNRLTHDAFKQMSEFIEYSKGMKVGMVRMNVEGGFDKVDIDYLSTVLY